MLRCGPDALSDHELLALVLRHGRQGESALSLAASLLAEHGTLSALAAARPEELATRSGIGVAKAAALVAVFQLGRRITLDDLPIMLRSPDDVAEVARRESSAFDSSDMSWSDKMSRSRFLLNVGEHTIHDRWHES